ncbi:hypothetical protein C2S52_022319 [Perilla frutescens var. hirtella]|nr:hypothetical protein C2S52_022319 [Perilla frutescens var. hirtella]
MEYVFQLLLLFIYITISSYAADFVQNPDFEIPPANLTTANATAGANSIPGWSVNGTVWYVPLTSSSGGGHAVQLGPNGKISQTIKATGGDDVLHYILSFTVAAQNQDCANNLTALNLTLHDSWDTYASKLIYMQKNSTRNLWERHALYLGQLGGRDYVHLQIESVTTNSQHNVTCWPLVDAFTVNTNFLPRWYNGNWMSNGGFEVGPAFLKNFADGIILTSEEEMLESPLQQWSILGTIRYIDSRHYRVPRGEAAVELLSGDPSGVRADFTNLPTKYTYTLNFTVGDANDSCVGDFTVHVQVGSSALYNFTMHSNGTGSAFKQSLKFKVDEKPSSSRETSITFYSFDEGRTRAGLLCGPVLDSIFLAGSYGERVRPCICNGILLLVFSFFIAFNLHT